MKQFKPILDKGSKLSRAFKKELASSEELTTEVHAELMRRESSKIPKDVESELNWLKVGCFLNTIIIIIVIISIIIIIILEMFNLA